MDPTLLFVAVAKHGVDALVTAFTDNDSASAIAKDFTAALLQSEAQTAKRLGEIENRLSGIEQQLDQLLQQAYFRDLKTGIRFMRAATEGAPKSRRTDLERARTCFMHASSATEDPLQIAVAEHHLLLVTLGLGLDSVAESVSGFRTLDKSATTAALDATEQMGQASSTATSLLRRSGQKLKRQKYDETLARRTAEVEDAARSTVELCWWLLSTSARATTRLGLPRRTVPQRRMDPRGAVYWALAPEDNTAVRFGALTAALHRSALSGSVGDAATSIDDHMSLRFDPPIEREVVVQPINALQRDVSTLDSERSEVEVPLRPSADRDASASRPVPEAFDQPVVLIGPNLQSVLFRIEVAA